jgi:murein DD-endopeptidase MepM/ murein hydrolase activator NlpD
VTLVVLARSVLALLVAAGAAVGQAPAAAVARAAPWQLPVRGPVVRAFALSPDRFARGQHRGVDLAAALGAPVGAACGGRVRFAGRVPGGGRTVSVVCGRLVATYQHLGALTVRRGQLLAPGANVGTVGRSVDPRARRPHLHLGARETASGRYLDPLTLLGSPPRAAPPVGGSPRRPLPLGRAPRSAVPRPVPRPAPPTAPVPAADPPGAPARSLPVVVWIGLAAFGFGLPLGGLLTVRRRRRRPVAASLRIQGMA